MENKCLNCGSLKNDEIFWDKDVCVRCEKQAYENRYSK